MEPVTIDDRKAELRALLGRIQLNPSRDWSRERARLVILQQMIAADEAGKARA